MGAADEEGRYVAVRGVRGWRGGRDGYGVGTEGTAVLRGWVWWQGVRGVDGGDGGADQRHHHRDRHHLPPHPLVDLVRLCAAAESLRLARATDLWRVGDTELETFEFKTEGDRLALSSVVWVQPRARPLCPSCFALRARPPCDGRHLGASARTAPSCAAC